jgi:hypothetical protein
MAERALALAPTSRAAYLNGVHILRPSAETEALPARRIPLALVLGIAVAAALLVAASLLWVSYGTTVFFEMISAGIAACF